MDFNFYRYVGNNPAVLIDPLGHGAKGAAIGAGIGGAVGGVGGGIVGGTGGAATGAAGCTLVAPGVGTVGCGVAGGAAGATAGATVGAAWGAAVGAVIGDTVEDVIDWFKKPKAACNQKEKNKDDAACYAVYLADTAYCGEHFTNDTEYEACMEIAWLNYDRCKKGLSRLDPNPRNPQPPYKSPR